MGELKMSEGILNSLLRSMPFSSMSLSPVLTDRDLVIEVTQDQLREILLANADERARRSISVECHEGKIVLRVRLI